MWQVCCASSRIQKPSRVPITVPMDKIATKRLSYEHQGRKIYEWEQTLEEIHVFIEVPPGVKAKMLDIKIDAKRLRVGLRGNPPFIDVRAATRVNTSAGWRHHLHRYLLFLHSQEPFANLANASDSVWTLGACTANHDCSAGSAHQPFSLADVHRHAVRRACFLQRTVCCTYRWSRVPRA